MDREIWVEDNRIYLGDDNILYFINVGEINENIARGSCEAMLKLRNMGKGTVHFLIDLNKGGKTTTEARTILKEFTERNVHGKLAFWGLNPVAKVLGSFFMGITKKKDIRFFNSQEEALLWIKE